MKKSFSSPGNDAALAKLCAEWQKRLRLQDWDVLVSYISKEEKEKEEIGCAITEFHSQFKSVKIKVARPEDVAQYDICTDIEVTLVHELLHLCCDPFDHFFTGEENKKSHPTEFRAMEQMIETVAIALVYAKRGTA